MFYSEFVEVYEELVGTTKKLEKATIIAKFLKRLEEKGEKEWIYLLKGKVVADYDAREIGISEQLAIKAIGKSFGVGNEEIVKYGLGKAFPYGNSTRLCDYRDSR